MNCAAVILAAGEGKRMKSRLPKVLHPLCGKPMIQYVIDELNAAGISDIIAVIGHAREQIIDTLQGQCHFAVQDKQLGTGHALQMALPVLKEKFPDSTHILLCCGDTPLLTADLFSDLISSAEESKAHAVVVSALMNNPAGYGRIIRTAQNTVAEIIEHRDCSEQQLQINEINSGLYVFSTEALMRYIEKLKNSNAQNEYYLTDIIKIFADEGLLTFPYICTTPEITAGINDRSQLSDAEIIIQKRIQKKLMMAGVSIHMPDSVFIDSYVTVGQETIINGPCTLKNCSIGSDCIIGPFVSVENSSVDNNSTLRFAEITNNTKTHLNGVQK